MPDARLPTSPHLMHRQRGAALMLFLVIMVIGALTLFVNSLLSSTNAVQIERDKATAVALAQAKEALIAYAVSDSNRPGELPCPDFNNDGMISLADYSGSNCQTLVGWLPWKTLGLPELRDANGNHLWYAVAAPFHANSSATLNSDTPVTFASQMLTVNDGATGTTLETGVIAVVFSPGASLAGEARNANDNNAASVVQNYLEGSNATANTIVFQTANNTTINDRLLTINYASLFPAVEMRIAREARKCLDDYAAANASKYPWAAPVTDSTYTGTYSTYFGRIPATLNIDTSPGPSPTTDTTMSNSWPAVTSCTSLWGSTYWANWEPLVFYQVADGYRPGGSVSCGSCLSISGSGNTSAGSGTYRAAVIVARQALASQTRSFSSDVTYLEGINPHATAPSTTFETYKTSDNASSPNNYTNVNDLVLCVDGKVNCQ